MIAAADFEKNFLAACTVNATRNDNCSNGIIAVCALRVSACVDVEVSAFIGTNYRQIESTAHNVFVNGWWLINIPYSFNFNTSFRLLWLINMHEHHKLMLCWLDCERSRFSLPSYRIYCHEQARARAHAHAARWVTNCFAAISSVSTFVHAKEFIELISMPLAFDTVMFDY